MTRRGSTEPSRLAHALAARCASRSSPAAERRAGPRVERGRAAGVRMCAGTGFAQRRDGRRSAGGAPRTRSPAGRRRSGPEPPVCRRDSGCARRDARAWRIAASTRGSGAPRARARASRAHARRADGGGRRARPPSATRAGDAPRALAAPHGGVARSSRAARIARGRREASRRALGHRAQDRGLDGARDGPLAARGRAAAGGVSRSCLPITTTLEAPSKAARSGEHLVEHAPERVEVRAAVDRIARDLLGRHVLGRPEDREAAHARARGRSRAGGRCRSAPWRGRSRGASRAACRPSPVQHQVLRLQVAVNEARRVRRLERLRRLDRDPHGLAPARGRRSRIRASSVSPAQSSIARKTRPSSDLPKS